MREQTDIWWGIWDNRAWARWDSTRKTVIIDSDTYKDFNTFMSENWAMFDECQLGQFEVVGHLSEKIINFGKSVGFDITQGEK